MINFLKLFKAFKRYYKKDIKYFLIYCFNYFKKEYKNNCHFYSIENFVKQIYKGKSFIRMGDGEIAIIHYLSINYQDFNKNVRNDFLNIVSKYNEQSPYILLLPLFVNYSNSDLRRMNKFEIWMPLKVTYRMIFNKNLHYFDAHFFYKKDNFQNYLIPYIKNKKVILVTNKNIKKMIGGGRGLGFEIYDLVVSPSKNSHNYSCCLEIEIRKIIGNSGFSSSEFVILMVAGLSKTIIFNLSNDGYQCLDVGKGFEGFLKKENLEYLI